MDRRPRLLCWHGQQDFESCLSLVRFQPGELVRSDPGSGALGILGEIVRPRPTSRSHPTVSLNPPAAVVVLAAGEGTRMKSAARPKVLHEIAGRSLVAHAVAAA